MEEGTVVKYGKGLSKPISGLTDISAPKRYVSCKKTTYLMLTSVRNALWARGPWSGAKMVASLGYKRCM